MRPKTTRSKYEPILDEIGRQIVDHEMAVGSVVTLAAIEEKYRCSRTVAREVQRALESYGLVRAQRRVGLVVQSPEQWNVFDPDVIRWRLSGVHRERQLESLTALRLAIEPSAAASAARFASKAQREEILAAGERLVKAGEVDSGADFLRADIAYHRLILQYSGNEMFAALAPVVESVLTWRTELGLMPPHPEPRALEDHRMIAHAIYRGEPERAALAMRDLVDEVREAFQSEAPNALRYSPGPFGKHEQK